MINEYEMLRNEIMQKIDLVNSLITFTLTTSIAILTFALTNKNSVLCLLPFGIIIPMYIRISYYRSAMVKLSAYIIVFLEKNIDDINWETRNRDLMNHVDKSEKTIVWKAEYYEGVVVSMVCYLLYFYNYSQGKSIDISLKIYLSLPFTFIIWVGLIIRHINNIDKERNEWINEWKN